MSEAFNIISEFLEQFEGEAFGRGTDCPDSETMEEIARFGRGELTAQERLKIVAILEKNPSWIPLLAKEIRASRSKEVS
jgi:hypothetical protein